MKYQSTLVKLENIVVGDNVRIPNNLRLDTLADSIETNGIQEPLVVWESKKGQIDLLKGHRRTAALGVIARRNPSRFTELFGKGIPCLMVGGITDVEALLLKCDHDGQEGLSDPHELQLTANMLFRIGRTEAEVIALTSGLMDKISPMSPSVRHEIADLIAKNDKAGVEKRTLEYRRGLVQGLHNAFRCPDVVMFALYRKAVGVAPDGVTEYLPPLTSAQVTALWDSHRSDLAILEGGVPKYSKGNPGPLFREKWAALCAKAQTIEEKGKTPKAKSMPASEMSAEITNRGYRSELTCKLIAHHIGDKSVSAEIPALDNASYYGDLIRKHDPDAWAALVSAGKEIEKRLAGAAAR